MLLNEFFLQHADEKLAPKTVERYREQAVYLAPELLALPITEITPLHLAREWKRLLEREGITGARKLLGRCRLRQSETWPESSLVPLPKP